MAQFERQINSNPILKAQFSHSLVRGDDTDIETNNIVNDLPNGIDDARE